MNGPRVSIRVALATCVLALALLAAVAAAAGYLVETHRQQADRDHRLAAAATYVQHGKAQARTSHWRRGLDWQLAALGLGASARRSPALPMGNASLYQPVLPVLGEATRGHPADSDLHVPARRRLAPEPETDSLCASARPERPRACRARLRACRPARRRGAADLGDQPLARRSAAPPKHAGRGDRRWRSDRDAGDLADPGSRKRRHRHLWHGRQPRAHSRARRTRRGRATPARQLDRPRPAHAALLAARLPRRHRDRDGQPRRAARPGAGESRPDRPARDEPVRLRASRHRCSRPDCKRQTPQRRSPTSTAALRARSLRARSRASPRRAAHGPGR